jgi:hypothetical protein
MRLVHSRFSMLALVTLASAAGFRSGGWLSAAQQAGSQTTPSSCPVIKITCPNVAQEGTTLSFTAVVSDVDKRVTPTFNWAVSAGTISSGQGTSEVTVDTTGLGESNVTAYVDVGGYARGCETSASCRARVVKRGPPAVKFSEYTPPDLSANRVQLGKWVGALKQDPSAVGYLIAYGGRTSRPEDAQTAANNALNYTKNVLKMEGKRTLYTVGGYRERPTVELWIAPKGGTPPMSTPTLDPKDVKPAPVKPAAKPAQGHRH